MDRRLVWWEPCPLVGVRAVDLGPSWLPGYRKVLYRDMGRCGYCCMVPANELIDRDHSNG